MRAVLAIVLLLVAGAARADVYGYIDASGQTHLADEKLDDRYTLFMKSGPEPASPAIESAPDAAPTRSKLFQRLVAHPNIARFEPMIQAAAAKHGVDPMLIKAVIAVESGFEPSAVSEKGAVGLMQVLPATGERFGLKADRKRTVAQKLADPAINLDIGTRYLAQLRQQFAARPELALAAYNAGENTVVRYRMAIPPYPETQAYVRLVDQFHAFYRPTSARTPAGSRVKVVIAARRNLPDPAQPVRLPAPRLVDPT